MKAVVGSTTHTYNILQVGAWFVKCTDIRSGLRPRRHDISAIFQDVPEACLILGTLGQLERGADYGNRFGGCRIHGISLISHRVVIDVATIHTTSLY